jgi:sugar lactone lactonase YvrE
MRLCTMEIAMRHAIHRLLPCLFLLSGCSVHPNLQSVAPTLMPQMSGRVHGGQQPVAGATVQLWQVGSTGYGSAPAQLGTPATTGADGSFTITGHYTCPSFGTFVYVTAVGGNPGLAPGTNNGALAMMSALGVCGGLTSSTFVAINEVTTVASVYALDQFMNSAGGVGGFSANAAGISNAFANAGTLVDTSTGSARTSPTGGSTVVGLPVAALNTLANILVPCVNSASASSSACTSLFSAVSPATPGNTLTAAMAIALNPSRNVSGLFNLSTANAAFQPSLATAPNDWTLAVNFALGGAPSAIALDSSGSLWTAAFGNGGNTSTVSEMTAAGFPAANSPFSNVNLSGADGIAIDTSNNVWVSNFTTGTALELGLNSNTIQVTTVLGSANLSGPKGIAIDGARNIWFANYSNNTVTKVSSGLVPTTLTSNSFSGPQNIAIDVNGNAWVADLGGNLAEISNQNSAITAFTGGGLSSPTGIAVDGANNLWVTNSSSARVAEIAQNGTAVSSSSGYTGGGLNTSQAVAVDGSGNIWVANQGGSSISELSPAGSPMSPTNGFVTANLQQPSSIAIDAAGDVWLGNSSMAANGTTVTEFVGLAAPTAMPIVQAVQSASVGKRPGTLTITMQTLSNATLNVPYSLPLDANGGNGPYTWSITSGGAALQAAGLTLSSTGTLAGTPNAVNSYPITVQVADPSTGQTASQAFTLLVISPPATTCSHDGTGNAVLNGKYAFLLSGFNPGGHFFDEIGNFQADGAGSLSAGSADVNGDQNIAAFGSGELHYSFTGTYSVGNADLRGIAQFNNSNGTGTAGIPTAAVYCFAADSLDSNGVAHSGRIIEADQSGFVMTGSFEQQTIATPALGTIATGYAFGLQGVDGTTPNRRGMIGQFTPDGNGNIVAGQLDTSAYSPGQSTATYAAGNVVTSLGSGYTVAANGRGTLTLNVGGSALAFVTYVVGNGSELYVMSANAGASGSTPLLLGKAMQQTMSGYTLANIQGTAVYTSSGTTDPSTIPYGDKVQIGQITFNGTGGESSVFDENAGGLVNGGAGSGSPEVSSTTYSVTPSGYLTIGVTASTNYYLYGYDAGFGLSNNTGISLYTLGLQTLPVGGLVNAYLNGVYSAGTVFPSSYNTGSNSNLHPSVFDVVTTFASGTVMLVQDQVAAPGTAGYIQTGATASNSFAVDSTYGASSGRFSISNGSGGTSVVGYFVSPTQLILLQQRANKNSVLIQAFHQ